MKMTHSIENLPVGTLIIGKDCDEGLVWLLLKNTHHRFYEARLWNRWSARLAPRCVNVLWGYNELERRRGRMQIEVVFP